MVSLGHLRFATIILIVMGTAVHHLQATPPSAPAGSSPNNDLNNSNGNVSGSSSADDPNVHTKDPSSADDPKNPGSADDPKDPSSADDPKDPSSVENSSSNAHDSSGVEGASPRHCQSGQDRCKQPARAVTPGGGREEARPSAQKDSSHCTRRGTATGTDDTATGSPIILRLMQTVVGWVVKGTASTPRPKLSPGCQRDLDDFAAGVVNMDEWALRMADAYGKPQSGMFTGRREFIGDEVQCARAHKSSAGRVVQGRMCVLTVFTNISAYAPHLVRLSSYLRTVNYHVCVPRSCSQDDVTAVFDHPAAVFGGKLTGARCVQEKTPSADPYFRYTVFTLSLLALLCILGTWYDVASAGHDTADAVSRAAGDATSKDKSAPSQNKTPQKARSRGAQVLLCFSLVRNGKKILSLDHGGGDLACIHGVRALACMSIIFVHVLSYNLLEGMAVNVDDVLKATKDVWTSPLTAAYGVDLFFLMSGCLAVVSFARRTGSQKNDVSLGTVARYFRHRYWRLTPLMAVMSVVHSNVLPYLCNGPFDRAVLYQSDCSSGTWSRLFYVENLVGDYTKHICVLMTWSVMSDMQFHLLAVPLVLVPWARGKRKTGLAMSVALLALHIGCTIFSNRGTAASSFAVNFEVGRPMLDYLKYTYMNPLCRIGPFAVGLLLGYALFIQRPPVLTAAARRVGWLVAGCAALVGLYGRYPNIKDYYDTGRFNWTNEQDVLYDSVNRPLFALFVAWAIFVCGTGQGGPLNDFLSWRGWLPISRLSYGIYLWHPLVHDVMASLSLDVVFINGWNAFKSFLGLWVVSCEVALAFSLMVEWPGFALEKVFFH